jgi:hypothetical protein
MCAPTSGNTYFRSNCSANFSTVLPAHIGHINIFHQYKPLVLPGTAPHPAIWSSQITGWRRRRPLPGKRPKRQAIWGSEGFAALDRSAMGMPWAS